MLPKISIIIPVFNTGAPLKRCVNSILKQTFTDFEMLLVNDGSTDKDTVALCHYYAGKDARVKVFNKENEGIEKTRVFGIRQATGDYIMFSDHDDYYEKNAFQKLYDNALKSGADIVVANNYHKKIRWLPVRSKTVRIDHDFEVDNAVFMKEYYGTFFGCHRFGLETWNKLYRTNIIKTTNFKFVGFNLTEDVVLNSQIFPKAGKISFINEYLYTHIWGGESSGKSKSIKWDNIIWTYSAMYDFRTDLLKKYGCTDIWGKFLFYELKNVLVITIDRMIESGRYSKDEFFKILKKFRETIGFKELATFYNGTQRTVALLANGDYEKIYDEAYNQYQKRKYKVQIKEFMKNILRKIS